MVSSVFQLETNYYSIVHSSVHPCGLIMDGIRAIQSYVDRVVTGDGRCLGMKVLLLDSWTTQTVSCVYSQNQVLQREVYLVSRLDIPSAAAEDEEDEEGRRKTSHMKAVCFLRPNDTNASLLARELAQPRFAEYHLFFSGILSTGLLRLIAEADEFELVKQVQEFYGDFLPVNEDLATLNCHYTIAMTAAAGTARAADFAQLYDRSRQGIESLLLALKRQPRTIRYQASSVWAQQMARDLHQRVQADQTFHFRNTNTMLLLLDRMDDPVTPLLSQWTYQAMVHELLGINNNRVLLKGAPNVPKDLQEVVLSSYQDAFFRNNRFANFGELGEAIQQLLKEYQKNTQTHSVDNINTIEQMQHFMEKYPELRSQSHTVSKHVEIFGELARLVQLCSLMDISQFEQDLACTDDHSVHFRQLIDTLANPTVKVPDKLRLGLLYALRYEQSGNVSRIKMEMRKGGVPDELILLMDCILRYAGITLRGPGLFGIGTQNVMKKMTKSIMSSVQGVSNVYAQHVPLLIETLQAAAKGKLKHDNYPFVMTKNITEEPPEEIIVFMVGGVTYEEAAKVQEFNRGKIKVFLCGSTIHNSTSFLEELKALVRN
jgi:vacuolar protein sorting-associated protein 45